MSEQNIQTSHAHILVVDDDNRLRELLQQYLTGEGYDVTTAESSAIARRCLQDAPFDLLVVDVMMPHETGVEFVMGLRNTSQVPVLMLTAMGEVEDRIAGLQSGADDYLVKPFEPKELLLRIENILKRVGEKKKGPVCFGPFSYVREESTLYKDKEVIHLTSTEAKMMSIFANQVNEPISREALSKMLNGISERSVDVQVVRLRKKIEEDPKNPVYLQTSWGSGYVLKNRPDVRED